MLYYSANDGWLEDDSGLRAPEDCPKGLTDCSACTPGQREVCLFGRYCVVSAVPLCYNGEVRTVAMCTACDLDCDLRDPETACTCDRLLPRDCGHCTDPCQATIDAGADRDYHAAVDAKQEGA
jgi:hypothetical protein